MKLKMRQREIARNRKKDRNYFLHFHVEIVMDFHLLTILSDMILLINLFIYV